MLARIADLEATVATLKAQGGSGSGSGLTMQAVLDILGPTGIIVPMVDNGTFNTQTTMTAGAETLLFNYSKSLDSFTTQPSYIGSIPVVDFNGIDESASTADANFWTSPGGFSIGIWLNLDDNSMTDILGKWMPNRREFLLGTDSGGRLNLVVYDEAKNAQVGRFDGVVPTGQWVFVVATYDGGTTSGSVRLYLDGQREDVTNYQSGAGWKKTRNTSSQVELGNRAGSRYLDGRIAGGPLGMFFAQRALTPTEVTTLYDLQRVEIGQ